MKTCLFQGSERIQEYSKWFIPAHKSHNNRQNDEDYAGRQFSTRQNEFSPLWGIPVLIVDNAMSNIFQLVAITIRIGFIQQIVAAQWQCATRMPQCTSRQEINTEEAEEVACDEAILVFFR